MSHQPERKEKNCLNCGATVIGRYCHVCGQENIETEETFFSLLRHFVFDIFHFDSKFFDTLKFLLFRPGYVSRQYVAGKRAHYLNPIQMYLFTSAVFFLFVFSFRKPENGGFIQIGNAFAQNASPQERLQTLQELKEDSLKRPSDTAILNLMHRLRDTTHAITLAEIANARNTGVVQIDDNNIKTVSAYDSFQKTLPPNKRDNWISQKIIKQGLAINSKYQGNVSEGLTHFFESFVHKLPYLFFVSLPFFAGILKLLYIRRKQFYYSDHAVFTLHCYIFSFILLLVASIMSLFGSWMHFKLFQSLIPFLLLLQPVYLLLAQKNFYQQGWGKTFSKFLLLYLLGFIVLLLLFVGFLFFTLFQL